MRLEPTDRYVPDITRALSKHGIIVSHIDIGVIAVNRTSAHCAPGFTHMHEFDIAKRIIEIARLAGPSKGARIDFGIKTDEDWFITIDAIQS